VGSNIEAEGGAIWTKNSLTVSSCTFSGCTSNACGGGAIGYEGDASTTFTVENTAFLFCESYGLISYSGNKENDPRVGGAIRLRYTGIYCINCSFLNCKTNRDGGAIALYSSGSEDISDEKIELDICTFVSNFAGDGGGAIEAREMALKCSNCSFLYNKANEFGSAIAANIAYSVEYQRNGFVRNIVLNCDETGGSAVQHYCEVENATIYLNATIFLENEPLSECSSSIGIFYFLFFFFYYIKIHIYRKNYRF
jgi:predicted outer membrane repeat protein